MTPVREEKDAAGKGRPLIIRDSRLGGGAPDVLRAVTLRARLAEVELDAISLAEIFDALTLNGAGVEEHFLASGISNKAEALV